MSGLFLPKGFKERLVYNAKRYAAFTPFGGGVIKAHTLLTAQQYHMEWDKLVSDFPVLRNYPDAHVQWQQLVQLMGPQGVDDPDMWRRVALYRQPVLKGGRRRVRDRVITTAFVDFIVDQLQAETSAFGDFKYHDSGTGTDAEAITDTGLGTAWGGSRDTGTQTETDHDTYKSVATTTYNATKAITEHGLFNTSDSATLMDRTVFAAINVVDTNQIEWTFEASFTAGG